MQTIEKASSGNANVVVDDLAVWPHQSHAPLSNKKVEKVGQNVVKFNFSDKELKIFPFFHSKVK